MSSKIDHFFKDTVCAAIKKYGESNIADYCEVGIPTLRRWAQGTAVPMKVTRVEILNGLISKLHEHESTSGLPSFWLVELYSDDNFVTSKLFTAAITVISWAETMLAKEVDLFRKQQWKINQADLTIYSQSGDEIGGETALGFEKTMVRKPVWLDEL